MQTYPRYAFYRARLVRILNYLGDGRFEILDRDDSRRVAHRDTLTFRR